MKVPQALHMDAGIQSMLQPHDQWQVNDILESNSPLSRLENHDFLLNVSSWQPNVPLPSGEW